VAEIQAFHMNCQRHILDIKWYDFVTNESICTNTSLADIRDIVFDEEERDFLATLLILMVVFQQPVLLSCAATPKTSHHQT